MDQTLPIKKTTVPLLKKRFQESIPYEIGIDEAGRGPLFGRLYVAGVVLPKDELFDSKGIRDSKKITSKKKIQELSEYIKSHALSWHIQYIESDVIDKINIRQAVLQGMRECVKQNIMNVQQKKGSNDLSNDLSNEFFILVDGNDFSPYIQFDERTETMKTIPHETVTGGDNLYVAIASASILAKVARDAYIEDLCAQYPQLSELYGLDTNMGYGTKTHLDGIRTHGITKWHRKTYGSCKTANENEFLKI
jgi:ribonuclease HII